jgi:hypothetical protein
VDVVHKLRSSGEESLVLVARHRLPHKTCHQSAATSDVFAMRLAASETAVTMFA